MPKTASSSLIWSEQHKRYEFYEQHGEQSCCSLESHEHLLAWLNRHTSFSFHGRAGRLSLLKESRARGEDYWYAYRRSGGTVMKKYVGRTSDLSLERLEKVARVLNSENGNPRSVRSQMGVDEAEAEEGHASDEQHPLLMPKLHLPRQYAFIVARERLFAQLNSALERKLTLVSAPAGYGKSTLVSSWAARLSQQGGPGVAWLSLDEGDNDPIRFWRYVIAACQNVHPSIGQHALFDGRMFSFTREQVFLVVTALLNALHDLPGRGVLVLEDYHVISTSLIHQSLTALLDH